MTDQLKNWIPTREAIRVSGYSESRLRVLHDEEVIQRKLIARIAVYYLPEMEELARKRQEKIAKRRKKKSRKPE